MFPCGPQLYSRIKGLSEAQVAGVVASSLINLGLSKFEHKLAGTLSGGNKRKLSVAIALIAEPPIVFLGAAPDTGRVCVTRATPTPPPRTTSTASLTLLDTRLWSTQSTPHARAPSLGSALLGSLLWWGTAYHDVCVPVGVLSAARCRRAVDRHGPRGPPQAVERHRERVHRAQAMLRGADHSQHGGV